MAVFSEHLVGESLQAHQHTWRQNLKGCQQHRHPVALTGSRNFVRASSYQAGVTLGEGITSITE